MLRLIRLLIAAVAALYLVVFAVQNRGAVDIVLWPGFVPLTLPVWGLVLATTVIGVILCGVVMWLYSLGWRSEAARAQRTLKAQEVRRQMAEQREEERAAAQAAARRAAAESQAKGNGTATTPPVIAGTKPLALSSS
jgi:uncharacterized integral membrane protein